MFQKKTKDPQENRSSSMPFIFGFVSGVVAGVLFAPTEGSKTRKTLGKTIKSFVNDFEDSDTGKKIISNPNVIKASQNITKAVNATSEIKQTVEEKATSILTSPIVKKISKPVLSSLSSSVNKTTGKKFITKKK